MADAESIREWLDDDVKAGYGAKFASAFEECGIEDKSDLHDVEATVMVELERELSAAGVATSALNEFLASFWNG